jgi:hypothetical protein
MLTIDKAKDKNKMEKKSSILDDASTMMFSIALNSFQSSTKFALAFPKI